VIGRADHQYHAVQIFLDERAVAVIDLSAFDRRAQRFGQLRADDGHASARGDELLRLTFGDCATANEERFAPFEIEIDRVITHDFDFSWGRARPASGLTEKSRFD